MNNRTERKKVQLEQSQNFIDEYQPNKIQNVAEDSAFIKKMNGIKFNEFTIGQQKRVYSIAIRSLRTRRRIDKEIANQIKYRAEIAHEMAMNPESAILHHEWHSINSTIRVLKSLVAEDKLVGG